MLVNTHQQDISVILLEMMHPVTFKSISPDVTVWGVTFKLTKASTDPLYLLCLGKPIQCTFSSTKTFLLTL